MKTHIVILSDKSGSMALHMKEIEQGYNDFLTEQKKLEDECTFSSYQFNDKFEEVDKNVKIQFASEFKLRPRGMTALYDAIGKTIDLTEKELVLCGKINQPDRIMVVILTDGKENCSKEYTYANIQKLIENKKKVNWQFIFLASELESYNLGQQWSCVAATFAQGDYNQTFSYLSNNMTTYRSCDNVNFVEYDKNDC